jgi:hypothetical protein
MASIIEKGVAISMLIRCDDFISFLVGLGVERCLPLVADPE